MLAKGTKKKGIEKASSFIKNGKKKKLETSAIALFESNTTPKHCSINFGFDYNGTYPQFSTSEGPKQNLENLKKIKK